MQLISPSGVIVGVSDEKGERLKKLGYREPQSEKTEAPVPATKRRGRPKKTQTESEH